LDEAVPTAASVDLATCDAVLFDLDGVLIDSRVPFSRSVNAALAELGLPERPARELHAFIGPPMEHTMRTLVGDGPGADERVAAAIAAYRRRYEVKAAEETTLMPGVAAAVARIAARVPVVVATSKPQAYAGPLLEALGLRAPFRAVVGPDLSATDEPKDVTIGRALRELPEARAAVMVGDRRFDVLGARAHGLRSVGALWGIGTADELEAAGADALAATPAELVALLGA
jgi:phosphoglycolate phosphatase